MTSSRQYKATSCFFFCFFKTDNDTITQWFQCHTNYLQMLFIISNV